MTDQITIIPQPITPARPQSPVRNKLQGSSSGVGSFDQLLQNKIEQGGVKFSKHATDRIQSRGIQFDSNQMQRLESAVSQVNAKGGRESLVMLDDTALVVSVKNDTVVTVVDREQLKNNVFTNIDSAVIA
ncbi:MAG: flagellar protein [Desulfuromusa sp.]|jgi:flagellar operon protein|nr:flagellar protein [Desulfuromusa sp.]